MLPYLASSALPVSIAPRNLVPSIHTHHCTSTPSHPNSSVILCTALKRVLHLLQPCCWLSCISHRPLRLGGCRRGRLQSRNLLQALHPGKKWNERASAHTAFLPLGLRFFTFIPSVHLTRLTSADMVFQGSQSMISALERHTTPSFGGVLRTGSIPHIHTSKSTECN